MRSRGWRPPAGCTLLQDAFAKMLNGQTSFEECKRVLR